jgi:hypothetical protein
MNDIQKHAVYNTHNVTAVFMNAMRQKHLVKTILTCKSGIDRTSPRRAKDFPHMSRVACPFERTTQRRIDQGNQKLLDAIMGIMQRKNKSIEAARSKPRNVPGGGDAPAVPGGRFIQFQSERDGIFRAGTLYDEQPSPHFRGAEDGRSRTIEPGRPIAITEMATRQPYPGDGQPSATPEVKGAEVRSESQEPQLSAGNQLLVTDVNGKAHLMQERQAVSRGTHRAGPQALETSIFSQASNGGFSQPRNSTMIYDGIDDPLLMRGSLNASYRKSEMNRINRANAVSIVFLI